MTCRGNTGIYIAFIIMKLFFLSNASGQRLIKIEQYSEAYFDSIRALVNDPTKENYTINAFSLGKSDEIVIDGLLNENAWQRAEHAGGFLESEPYQLVPMSEETEFAVLFDAENLYIGVWCYDSLPEKIVQRLAPRGTQMPDRISIWIDSFHDHRTGFRFMISPTGVQVDDLRYDDIRQDSNWNGVWYSAGSVDEHGWYAEMKIPLYNLRYSSNSIQTWGFNVQRFISRDASRGQWKPHLPEWGYYTRMSTLGHLKNIKGISSERTFEIRPYGVAGSTKTNTLNSSGRFSVGTDLRYRPTPNFSADFTLNPDFAQVDADVFEINLTRFPTRFQERRPFFTEWASIYNTPLELFYSRRIGAMGDILGGAKMTAKLRHGIELGMVGNLTGESRFSSTLIDPESAKYGVFRIKKDILGTSSIGVLAATKEETDRYNRIVGLDGVIQVTENQKFDFQIASGQYEMGYDQNMAYKFEYLREGDLVRMQFNFDRVEPSFEINRIGYIRKEADRGWNSADAILRISPRINKYHIRRIVMNLIVNHKKDIFTSRYINRWLNSYQEFIPDEMFGTVSENAEGNRFIEGGVRNEQNLSYSGDVRFNLLSDMSITAEFQGFTATELTGKYSGNFYRISCLTRTRFSGARYTGMFSASGGTFYNFDQKYLGSQRNLAVTGNGWVTNNLIVNVQGDITRTYNNINEFDGQYYKLSTNTNLLFSKDFFLRIHAQGIFGTTYYEHKQTYNEYLLSVLLSWEYRKGSFLYLAYNEGRVDESSPTLTRFFGFNNRTMVLKISYFFNV